MNLAGQQASWHHLHEERRGVSLKPVLLVVFRPVHRTSDLSSPALPQDFFTFILKAGLSLFARGVD